MIRTQVWLLVSCMHVAIPLISAADEATYAIKVDSEKLGCKSRVTRKISNQTILSQTVMGNKKTNEIKTNLDEVFVEEILARPVQDKPATKLTRVYEKSQSQLNGVPRARSYEGKTLLIELVGERYTFTVDGRNLPKEESSEFERRYNRERPNSIEVMLPRKPVKVNETWQVRMEPVTKLVSESVEIDPAKCSATGLLRKVYKKNGHQFGELLVKFDLAVNKVKLGSNWLPTNQGSKASIKIEADLCIDGAVPDGVLKSMTDFDLIVDVPAGPVQVKISSTEEVVGKEIASK